MVVFVYFFYKSIVAIPRMGWRWCRLYSIYRFVKITETGIIIHTEFQFSKNFVTESSPIKIDFLFQDLHYVRDTKVYLSVLKFAINCLTKLKKPKKLLKLFAYFGVCIFSVSFNFDLSGLLPSLEKKGDRRLFLQNKHVMRFNAILFKSNHNKIIP